METIKTEFTHFITNLHSHTKGDKCSVLVCMIYDTYKKNSTPISISLQTGLSLKLHYDYRNCIDVEGYEGITLYEKFYFCGRYSRTSSQYSNSALELGYNLEHREWETSLIGFMHHCEAHSLTSLYGTIFSIGNKIAQSMHISKKHSWIQLESTPVYPILYAALFTRNGHFLYALGGYTDISYSIKSNNIQYLDVKSHDGWKAVKMYNLYGICKCKCIQPTNEETIIIGGKQKEVYQIGFKSNDDVDIHLMTTLGHADCLEATMCPIYWNGAYNLLSRSGVFYRYFKNRKVLKIKKDWMEKELHVYPRWD